MLNKNVLRDEAGVSMLKMQRIAVRLKPDI